MRGGFTGLVMQTRSSGSKNFMLPNELNDPRLKARDSGSTEVD